MFAFILLLVYAHMCRVPAGNLNDIPAQEPRKNETWTSAAKEIVCNRRAAWLQWHLGVRSLGSRGLRFGV